MDTHNGLLSVSGLHVSYGTKEVLRGIDYDISEREVVAVLGANGSGKSTSLNAISGFVGPTAGNIVFDGENITGLPAHKIFRSGIIQVSHTRQASACKYQHWTSINTRLADIRHSSDVESMQSSKKLLVIFLTILV